MFIAATVLAHDYGVVTRNKSDFELLARHTPPQYPPLRIEVWK
jgi:predicted nucleic acid-binding protein